MLPMSPNTSLAHSPTSPVAHRAGHLRGDAADARGAGLDCDLQHVLDHIEPARHGAPQVAGAAAGARWRGGSDISKMRRTTPPN